MCISVLLPFVDYPSGVMRYGYLRIVVHSFCIRNTDKVSPVIVYRQRMAPYPRVHVSEQCVIDAPSFGKACQVFDGFFYLDFPERNRGIKFFCLQVEAESLRIGKQGLGCKDAVDVSGGLLYEMQVQGILLVLPFCFPGNTSLTGIVGGCHTDPVAEAGISLFQIAAGCGGGFLYVVAFVHMVVDLQSEFAGSGGHELPQAGGTCS